MLKYAFFTVLAAAAILPTAVSAQVEPHTPAPKIVCDEPTYDFGNVENTRDVDQRADIYSLGATLYECLCGQPPFDEVGVWKFVEAINEKPPPNLNDRVPNLHPEIWPVVAKALEPHPGGGAKGDPGKAGRTDDACGSHPVSQ